MTMRKLKDGCLVDSLVTGFNFELRCWSSRYGHGTWVALLPVPCLFKATDYATSAGSEDMFPSVEYLTSVDWLPIVLADNMTLAMDELESRLLKLNLRRSDNYHLWLGAVIEAMEHYLSLTDSADYGFIDERLKSLSVDFRVVWVE